MIEMKFFLLAPLAILILFSSSCGREEQSSMHKRSSNEVSIRLEAEPDRLNPLLSTISYARQVFDPLHVYLMNYDPTTLVLVPQLLKETPKIELIKSGVFEGGTKYSFEIREEAVWDDGKPVTAADYEATLKLVFNPFLPTLGYRTFLENIQSFDIDKMNPKKFTIILNDTYFAGLESLTNVVPVLPKHIFDADNSLDTVSLLKLISDPSPENQLKNYPEVGNMYIDDFPDEMEEEDHMGSLEDKIMEALKSKMTPKGEGIGHGPKFNYDKKPNMGGGFNEKRKEAFGKGTKAVGTGKAKFEYKEEKEWGGNKGDYKRKKVDGVEKKVGEKDGHYKDYEKSKSKKEEATEAVRTNSYPRANKVGNRKGSNQNVNREEIRVRPNTRSVNEEVEMLRERNEEYKKALDLFRTKLNEVAIFNSNLAYATRLFTEHSTTKQEKINILRRFDEVESLKESKNLYRSMKGELTNTTSNEKTITESIEKTVRTPASGSAANLIESKTYENPQFLRMKDLMSKIN
jgi:hypothetical protein